MSFASFHPTCENDLSDLSDASLGGNFPTVSENPSFRRPRRRLLGSSKRFWGSWESSCRCSNAAGEMFASCWCCPGTFCSAWLVPGASSIILTYCNNGCIRKKDIQIGQINDKIFLKLQIFKFKELQKSKYKFLVTKHSKNYWLYGHSPKLLFAIALRVMRSKLIKILRGIASQKWIF